MLLSTILFYVIIALPHGLPKLTTCVILSSYLPSVNPIFYIFPHFILMAYSLYITADFVSVFYQAHVQDENILYYVLLIPIKQSCMNVCYDVRYDKIATQTSLKQSAKRNYFIIIIAREYLSFSFHSCPYGTGLQTHYYLS